MGPGVARQLLESHLWDNFRLLPVTFCRSQDRDRIGPGDTLVLHGARDAASGRIGAENRSTGVRFEVKHQVGPRQAAVVPAGGLITRYRQRAGAVPR